MATCVQTDCLGCCCCFCAYVCARVFFFFILASFHPFCRLWTHFPSLENLSLVFAVAMAEIRGLFTVLYTITLFTVVTNASTHPPSHALLLRSAILYIKWKKKANTNGQNVKCHHPHYHRYNEHIWNMRRITERKTLWREQEIAIDFYSRLFAFLPTRIFARSCLYGWVGSVKTTQSASHS